jgi:hypothetical protein
MEPIEKLEQLIETEYKGNKAAFAARMRVTKQAVQDWFTKGVIPPGRIDTICVMHHIDRESFIDPKQVVKPRMTLEEQRKLYMDAIEAVEAYVVKQSLNDIKPSEKARIVGLVVDFAMHSGSVDLAHISRVVEVAINRNPR